jgi:hypothetical protein
LRAWCELEFAPDPGHASHRLTTPHHPKDRDGDVLDFDAPTLDRSRWLPHYLPQWSSRSAFEARYELTGSSLRLRIDEDQEPWCPEVDGAIRVSSLQTGCRSRPVGSRDGQHRFDPRLRVREVQPEARLYTPTYGWPLRPMRPSVSVDSGRWFRGCPATFAALRAEGELVNHKRVRRLRRGAGIVAITRRREGRSKAAAAAA